MKYQIYYFSATGNNQHCADLIKQNLQSEGHKVKTVYVCKSTTYEKSEYDTAIFIFPTYSFIAPHSFRKFIKNMPKVKGKKAAVLTADGGGCYNALNDIKSLLKRKGYNVIITYRISFPDNWMQVYSAADDKEIQKEIKSGENELIVFNKLLLKEQTHYYKLGFFSAIISAAVSFLFLFFGRRVLGKMYIADDDCNFCGLCAKKCPSAVIKLDKAKKQKPYWNSSCIACNRCINICPLKAVNSSLARIAFIIPEIIFLSAAGIYSYIHFIIPHFTFKNYFSGMIINIPAIAIIIIVSHIIPISLLDRFFLYKIQNSPLLKNIFKKTFTKKFKRYMRPGYKPETPA